MNESNTFRANPAVLEKVRGRKTSEIVQIVMYSLVFVLLLVLRVDETVRDLADSFDTTSDTVLSWLNFLTFGMVVMIIISAALAGVYSGQEQRLSASRITLEDDVVRGYSYAPDRSGENFRVAYSDIISVNATGYSEEINLTITTQEGVFQCLAIENSFLAAKEINARCEKCGKKLAVQPRNSNNEANYCPNCGSEMPDDAIFCYKCATKIPEKTHFANYCPNCGTEMPDDAVFCYKCATIIPKKPQPPVKEEKLCEDFAVEPVIFGQSIKCPVCGTIQRNDRNCCWECETRFVRKSDTDKA